MAATDDYTARDPDRHPDNASPGYRSTTLRAPTQAAQPIDADDSAWTGPEYTSADLRPLDSDLTRNSVVDGEPIGERIIVTGQVIDEHERPQAGALVEIWQANSAGRYVHPVDDHDAPLDPNFLGAGRTLTDDDGRYRFYTIKPGAYPWGNHANAWRPNHIHFSVCSGGIARRLVTQMYFPGDPLMALDPIFQSTPAAAREALIARFSIEATEPAFALGYVFDIVLRSQPAR